MLDDYLEPPEDCLGCHEPLPRGIGLCRACRREGREVMAELRMERERDDHF